MVEVYSKALNSSISVNRIIAEIHGEEKGPTIIFFGGIHGNEVSGVFALNEVLNRIKTDKIPVRGSIYAISGNLRALKKGERFLDKDLNRLWTFDNIYNKTSNISTVEDEEQEDILHLIEDIVYKNQAPFYFIDIHSTSSKSIPFITINDALINRRFSELFPVPIVLGIEEYLDGPLLSYINQLGYVSLGVEVGQHDEKESIQNAVAFINLVLVFTRSIRADDMVGFRVYFKMLREHCKDDCSFFEVKHREQITPNDTFSMNGNFDSFQEITRGQLLAFKNGEPLSSKENGHIFMPLYQKQGEDGFFIIKKINPFFLNLSAILRKLKFYNLLVLLPGVRWKNKSYGILEVNLKVAKFFARSISHLLGFRTKRLIDNRMLMYNREKVARTKDYRSVRWFVRRKAS